MENVSSFPLAGNSFVISWRKVQFMKSNDTCCDLSVIECDWIRKFQRLKWKKNWNWFLRKSFWCQVDVVTDTQSNQNWIISQFKEWIWNAIIP